MLESEPESWDNRCVIPRESLQDRNLLGSDTLSVWAGEKGEHFLPANVAFPIGTENSEWEKELQQKQWGLVLCSISSTGRACGCADPGGNRGHALYFIASKGMSFLLPSLCHCSLFCLKSAPEMEWKRSPGVCLEVGILSGVV